MCVCVSVCCMQVFSYMCITKLHPIHQYVCIPSASCKLTRATMCTLSQVYVYKHRSTKINKSAVYIRTTIATNITTRYYEYHTLRVHVPNSIYFGLQVVPLYIYIGSVDPKYILFGYMDPLG